MPKFITRVELHGANSKDYEKLHEAMEKKRFKRTIEGNKGVYHLPTAEYYYETSSDISATDVNNKAKSAAESVYDKKFCALTTKADEIAWSNLEKE